MSFIMKKKRLNLEGIFDDGSPPAHRKSRSYGCWPRHTQRLAMSFEELGMLTPVIPRPKGKPGPKPGLKRKPKPVDRLPKAKSSRPVGRPPKPVVAKEPVQIREKYVPSPEEVARVIAELRRRRYPSEAVGPGNQECE